MNKNIKLKGRLGLFYNWTIILLVGLACLNIGVYFYDVKSGVVVTLFLLTPLTSKADFVIAMLPFALQVLFQLFLLDFSPMPRCCLGRRWDTSLAWAW